MDKVEAGAKALSAKLDILGSDSETRQSLGQFAMMWTVFENNFELLMWHLKGFNEDGMPWTDKKASVAQWLQFYPEASEGNASASVGHENFCEAGKMLGEYRHAVFHGVYLPGLASTVRNPAWHGMIRKRPTHVAHIDSRLLKMAAIAANGLLQYVISVLKVLEGREQAIHFEAINGLSEAKSYANELRHITELMNSDHV